MVRTVVADPVTSTGTGTFVASVRNLEISLERDGVRSEIIRGVDLDIGRGEIVGVVGESGSGKSVMSLALTGLLPRSARPRISGTLMVAGVDMVTASEQRLRRLRADDLGVVFQDPMTSLNPTMRVGQQVEEAAGSAAEAVRLMRAVGIPQPEARFSSYPHELSGGLRQRVMIAMAIAGGPQLLVADEPTTALDVTVQAQVLAVLRNLRDEAGCSILMITHDLGVAAQVADRIAVMYAGRIAEVGPVADVLERPMHPYTLGLLGSRLDLSTDRSRPLRTLVADSGPKEERLLGCPYHVRCPIATTRCRDEVPPLVVMLPAPGVRPGLTASTGAGVGTGAGLDAGLDAERDGGAAIDEPVHRSACFFAETAEDRLGAIAPADAPPADASHVEASHVEASHVAVETAGPAVPVLEATEVHCTFTVRNEKGRRATLAALRGVTLDVQPGESIALVGESGSGKSTLLRVIAGLQRSFTGSVDGPGSRHVQMVFQDAGASLTPWMSVEELLDERLRGMGLSREERHRRVVDALELVGLPEQTARAKPSELSGGQRQRVALARATVVPPAILLCDEPTSALDVSLAASVLNLIARLRRELGMTVIFVTHDLAVARIISDRIAVMYLGRLVELGPADEVINDPRHPYTRALVSAIPGPERVLIDVIGEPASPLAPPSGCAFHPRCPVALPECASTLTGTQLVAIGPRHHDGVPRRSVACVHRGEI